MGHSPRRIEFQLFKTFTLKMKTFIFLATAVVLTTYSSPVPNPKPQIYNNKFFDYSQDCYDSQCQQNNQIGGGNQGGYNNYDYDYYGGGRGQGGNRRRLSVMRNKIREAKIVAHLWPPGLSGRRSCCVNCMINHPCRVISRFSSQRLEGAG